MTITHQILTDVDGKPVAALIPWNEFRVIQAELERSDDIMTEEFKTELNQRVEKLKNGTTKAIPHDELMADLRSVMADATPKKSA